MEGAVCSRSESQELASQEPLSRGGYRVADLLLKHADAEKLGIETHVSAGRSDGF